MIRRILIGRRILRPLREVLQADGVVLKVR